MMRSQMAEVFYNAETRSNDAISAGAIAETKEYISPRAIEAMSALGYVTQHLKPTQVSEHMVADADKVVYFPSAYMPDYVKQNPKSELWDIADPHYNKDKGMSFVCQVRDQIKMNVEKLVKEG